MNALMNDGILNWFGGCTSRMIWLNQQPVLSTWIRLVGLARLLSVTKTCQLSSFWFKLGNAWHHGIPISEASKTNREVGFIRSLASRKGLKPLKPSPAALWVKKHQASMERPHPIIEKNSWTTSGQTEICRPATARNIVSSSSSSSSSFSHPKTMVFTHMFHHFCLTSVAWFLTGFNPCFNPPGGPVVHHRLWPRLEFAGKLGLPLWSNNHKICDIKTGNLGLGSFGFPDVFRIVIFCGFRGLNHPTVTRSDRFVPQWSLPSFIGRQGFCSRWAGCEWFPAPGKKLTEGRGSSASYGPEGVCECHFAALRMAMGTKWIA